MHRHGLVQALLRPSSQDLANVLEHTLDLPTILPHGARVDPTSDGFLLWLPSCAHPRCAALSCLLHVSLQPCVRMY
jgi:hypothetical protein